MSKIKQLTVLADKFEDKLNAKDGEYGGKGKFELPPTHKAAMPVTKGGSCCKNCEYVNAAEHKCKNQYYIKWNGGDDKLPNLPLDEICSDWWEAK